MKTQIKSRKRVKNHGEVFTNEREVKAMLDMIPQDCQQITSTYLEPACGNGNFLVEIFRRKLALCNDKTDALVALQSIYAIDILADNVKEAQERLYAMYKDKYGDSPLAYAIVNVNIVQGDFLTRKTVDGKDIWFLEQEPEQLSMF